MIGHDWIPLWAWRLYTTWGEIVVHALRDEDDFWTPGAPSSDGQKSRNDGTNGADMVQHGPG